MPQLPLDNAGAVVQIAPASRANASRATAVSTAAVDFELTAGTRRVEVFAKTAALFIKYIDKEIDAATATSFDKFVGINEKVLIALPIGTSTINMISDGSATAYMVEYA